jgi:hypothetical protein
VTSEGEESPEYKVIYKITSPRGRGRTMGRPVAERSVAVFAHPLPCNPLPARCCDRARAALRSTSLRDLQAEDDRLDARRQRPRDGVG